MKHQIKSETGVVLDFRDRLFLLDILTDWSNNIVFKKCSQVGGSIIFTFKVMFAADKFGWNVIYTLPSDEDVREFVKSKTNQLIDTNKHVFGKLDSNSVEHKRIGKANLFYKGLNSDTAGIMTTAQVVVHDEISRSNQVAVKTMESRSKAVEASDRYKWIFSNPTVEKDALDEKWHESDKKEWYVDCPTCKANQPLVWPDSIDIARKMYICSACKVELPREARRTGHWKKTNPNSDISGYHISHLMCPWISAAEIIKDSEGDQEYFHNFVLGEPYSASDLRVNRATILDNWTPKSLVTDEYFLGVDVGNIKHYVLGSEKGIIKVGKFSEWSELDDIMMMYKPTLCIDAMPENTMSKHFVKNYRNAYMCYLNQDKNMARVIKWGEKEERGVIHADRNRLMDMVIDNLLQAKILYNVPSDGQFREYLTQCETLRRVKVINNLGIERYVWESTNGNDHFFFATMFYFLAVQSKGSGAFFEPSNKPEVSPIVETETGFAMNIEQWMEQDERYRG